MDLVSASLSRTVTFSSSTCRCKKTYLVQTTILSSMQLYAPKIMTYNTCTLWDFSVSSFLARSPSVYLDCNSCNWTSSFFFLCSTSCLAWFSDLISIVSSELSFSKPCLLFSKLTLTYGQKTHCKLGRYFANKCAFCMLIKTSYPFHLFQLFR